MASHHHQSRLARLPRWISHWLGYRDAPPPKQPEYVVWLWSFIGAFCGLSLIQAVFGHSQYFLRRNVPSVVASYGASAVLCYGAIEAPLAQPRALIGGHFVSALIGVCITKLFGLLPTEHRLDQLRWLAGSLSAASAVVLMQITKTTHPPAGATALLSSFPRLSSSSLPSSSTTSRDDTPSTGSSPQYLLRSSRSRMMKKIKFAPFPKNSLADIYRVEVRFGAEVATTSSPMFGQPFNTRVVYWSYLFC